MASKESGAKPKVATLPPGGKLRDFLASARESAKPPSKAGRSTGNLPQNRGKQ
jgi:hypothetical protein